MSRVHTQEPDQTKEFQEFYCSEDNSY